MEKMKVYKVYLDDGECCYKVLAPAFTEEQAKEYVAGNGEIVAIKETNDYPIALDKVADALKNASFGQSEIDIITRALSQLGLTNQSVRRR